MLKGKLVAIVLICMAFAMAPLQNAFATLAPTHDPMVQSIQDDLNKDGHSKTKLKSALPLPHHAPAAVENAQHAPCCLTDHTKQAGGFCADCLTLAIVEEPQENQEVHLPVLAWEATRGRSLHVLDDTPVPKPEF